MRVFTILLLSTIPAATQAELKPASIFSDHAVVQRDRPLTVWGTANPGAKVAVSLAKETSSATADENGTWKTLLKSQSASNTPQTLRLVSGAEVVEISDLLIGDVWHASGQSNMAMNVGAVLKSLPEVEEMVGTFDQPGLRFSHINEGPSRTPLTELNSQPEWTVCSAGTVRGFSATAFFFAATIHAEVDVPIGIIDTSRGGTPIEPFIPLTAFHGHPTLEREKQLGANDDLAGLASLRGGVRARDANWLPGRLFHSRLVPVSDYAVRGCIWYQGESNCGVGEDPRDYKHKMKALISGWRGQLGMEEMPFYFVQLPGFPRGTNWPYFREQQRLAAGLPHSGMVVTIDLVDENIHPANKFDVGDRLAQLALAKTYGRFVPFGGPMFSSATIDGTEVTVEFAQAESGLMTASKSGLLRPVENPGKSVNHFEITADGHAWHPAQAMISGRSVVVSSSQVKVPIAVRYAFSPAPEKCNLFNRDGFPASPFCSQPKLLKYEPVADR